MDAAAAWAMNEKSLLAALVIAAIIAACYLCIN